MGGRSHIALGISLAGLRKQLAAAADPAIARHSTRFFKTAPGEYGAGDRFRGIRVPQLRRLAREHRELPLADALTLLESRWHEDRLTALLILVLQFQKGDERQRRSVYRGYVGSMAFVNNWDLVDASAEHLVGGWLAERSRRPLFSWARSPNLWSRRIAIMATFHFIRRGEFATTLALSERLLDDPHDLIHKAVGWMLREVGNRDRAVEEAFLSEHCGSMPRKMLRYAIERFPQARRTAYLMARSEPRGSGPSRELEGM